MGDTRALCRSAGTFLPEAIGLVGTLLLLVWMGALALALAAAVRSVARLRKHVERPPVLDDDDVRDIIAHGIYVSPADEPLDLERVHEEERRFWEEAEWDEAEEW
jgi:hypothetical protein